MLETPFANAESQRVGSVEFVSPDQIKVQLDIEAPDAVALNTGEVRPFPRVNGYVLIPADDVLLVGQVEWLTVERSAFPKRGGVQDFGIVDLPYPMRKLSLNPLGALRKRGGGSDDYRFRRGSAALPSVGQPVLLPTDKQLRAIIESGEFRRISIGTSPLAANAKVKVDPDRLFGRHLAVLGNTGSGKSCSVAGLVRWSLEAARAAATTDSPNARFIILDPNGEYARAFRPQDSGPRARVFSVDPGENESRLTVPVWFWNSEEWVSFTHASPRAQKPLLRRALREVKAGRAAHVSTKENARLGVRRYLSSALIQVRQDKQTGAIRAEESRVGYRLRAIRNDLEAKTGTVEDVDLGAVVRSIDAALETAHNSFFKNGEVVEFYRAFNEHDIEGIEQALEAELVKLDGIVLDDGPSEDMPVPFSGTDLADHLETLAAQENVSQYVDFLVARIRTFLADSRISQIVSDSEEKSLEMWLNNYLGEAGDGRDEIAILDLSLVPSEIVHTIVAVAARVIFEALQRYRKRTGEVLPTVLVMEEAHSFIQRYPNDGESETPSRVCCQVFERIAREGRKFGMGLVLSSQRPSELSPTVLSQCNTFLLHRMSNDRDQELVSRLVPDNLRGLLRELPSLPSQNAILLGWAAELPILVEMRYLPVDQQPQSEDPDFWSVWVSEATDGTKVSREVDWSALASEWQGMPGGEDG